MNFIRTFYLKEGSERESKVCR